MSSILHKGGSDFLEICDGTSATVDVIRAFIIAQGDSIVHFSSEVTELLLSKSIQRWLVLTDRSLLLIPKSAIETGIFFDSRTALTQFSQVIVGEGNGEVNLLHKSPVTGEQMIAKSLWFANVSLRKTFLLALCVARPSVPILQRRKLSDGEPSSPSRASAPQQSTAPQPSSKSRDVTYQSPHQRRQQNHRDVLSLDVVQSPAPRAPSHEPVFDIADDVYSASRDRLREILCDSLETEDIYDPAKAASRPREEDPSRAAEREKIKADLDHRERKIIQNIEFKLKYPTRPATTVQPGVEYDKAHEERLTLPDDLADDELLGPALFSLWQEWKRTNGLVGHDDAPSEWNVYASNELIGALREKEEELFGFVGPRCLRKVRDMRELVARERLMYRNNRQAGSPISKAIAMSPIKITKPKPFSLSESPFSSLKAHVKLLERNQLVAQMKAKYEDHVKSRHELHKEHLNRQLQRLSPEK